MSYYKPNYVTLNDALHRTFVAKGNYDWLNGTTIDCMHSSRVPMMNQFGKDQILTYGDFVRLLAGGGRVLE